MLTQVIDEKDDDAPYGILLKPHEKPLECWVVVEYIHGYHNWIRDDVLNQ